MKIILTGASGLLGDAVGRAAKRRGHTIIATVHDREPDCGADILHPIDLSDQDAVYRFVLDAFPDVIVNAAAIADPAKAEADPASAERLNTHLPEWLSMLAHHVNARFIQPSTDLVFPGTRAPYKTTDETGPTGAYATQKAASERAVLAAGGRQTVVLRIPLLMGNSPAGERSVHERLFAAWSAGQTVTLHNDEIRQPTSADNVAEVIVELAERSSLSGIFHWAGAEPLSRHELAKRIRDHFNLPEELLAADSLREKQAAALKAFNEATGPERNAAMDALNAVAQRPENLALDVTPLDGKLKTKPEPLDDQLERLVIPSQFREWYNAL